MRPFRTLTLVIPLLLAHPRSALAQGDATAQAKQAFAAGAQAYREARYKDAIDQFLKANRLDPHADLIFNVGQAYEKLGDVPNALRSYREYLRLKPGANDRGSVEISIKNLEARLSASGVQQVSVFSTPSGATLILDQKEMGQTPWTGEIAPGRHIAVLRATGYPDVAKEFVLLSDRAMDLDIALPPPGTGAVVVPGPPDANKPPANKPHDPVPPGPVPPPEAKRSVAPWTIAALGVGVAGLGGALGFELARKSAENAARNDPTQTGYQSDLSTMNSRATAARALVAVGAVATAAGGVFLVLDLRGGGSSAPPAKAGLGCFMGACGAVASGRF